MLRRNTRYPVYMHHESGVVTIASLPLLWSVTGQVSAGQSVPAALCSRGRIVCGQLKHLHPYQQEPSGGYLPSVCTSPAFISLTEPPSLPPSLSLSLPPSLSLSLPLTLPPSLTPSLPPSSSLPRVPSLTHSISPSLQGFRAKRPTLSQSVRRLFRFKVDSDDTASQDGSTL